MTNRRKQSLAERLRNLVLLILIAGGIGFGISQFTRDEEADPRKAFDPDLSSNAEKRTENRVRVPRKVPNFSSDAATEPDSSASLTFERLAFIDPEAAARGVTGMPDSDERDEKLMILLETWSDTDPEGAAEWSAELPMGTFRVEALARVATLWTAKDRDSMRRWLELQQPPAHFLPAWGAFAMGWAAAEPEDAVNWTMGIRDPDARLRAESGIARQLAFTDPDFAQEWLSTITDVKKFDVLATQFVTAWAAEDPAATSAWINGQLISENKDLHRKAALLLAAHWTASDPKAAGEWINQLSDGPLREDAKFAFAQSLSASEPEIALAWADSIENETDRRDTVLGIYEEWLDSDPEQFKTSLVERWPKMEDASMRQAVYEILYDTDESFRKEVFSLLEGFIFPVEESPDAPANS